MGIEDKREVDIVSTATLPTEIPSVEPPIVQEEERESNPVEQKLEELKHSLSDTKKPIPVGNLNVNHLPISDEKVLEPNAGDNEYIKNYKRIQLGIDPNERAFVLTPRMFFEIEKILPDFTTKMGFILGRDNGKKSWEASPILSILAKSLLEESTKYSTWISEKIAQDTEKDQSTVICDLCSGAGITSAKIYTELKKNNVEHVQIHAIDNSIESIAVSYLLFKTQGIPCTVLSRLEQLQTIPPDYDGILLIYADAKKYMGKIDENIKYNQVVSENGISYFTEEEHNQVLNDSKSHLQEGARIFLASLNPELVVDLDKPFLFGSILRPRGKHMSEEYQARIDNGEPQYVVVKGKIKKAMTSETGKQIEFMRHLLTTNPSEFFKYMKCLVKATKAAMTLQSEIRSPVKKVLDSVSKIYDINKEEISSFPNIPGSPCDAIEIRV